MANSRNLKPWPKGVSGNPGGRPKKQPITEELERLLAEEAPNHNGQTWAAVIAEALLLQASEGDIKAISELANRVEGKPLQAFSVSNDSYESLAERLERARKPRSGLYDGRRIGPEDQRTRRGTGYCQRQSSVDWRFSCPLIAHCEAHFPSPGFQPKLPD
jgi:hypothetical protein